MENAVDAIKMGFGMLVFVIAMSAAMYLFTVAMSTSKTLLFVADKTNYYDNIEIGKNASGEYNTYTNRIVNCETIIPTLYRYYKENFAVQIIDGTGTLVQIFDLNIEGKVRKAAATPIGRRTDEQKALISLYGRALSSMDPTKNPNLFEAPWIGNTSKDTKTRIDLFVNGECGYINGTKVDYTANNLKRFQNSGAKFIEQYTEYAYKGDTISSEDGTETITGNTKPETKIVITYSVIF